MSADRWEALTSGTGRWWEPVLHFCLLSPCHCDGRQRGANVPRHASPLSAQLWAAAFTQRGSQAQRPSTSPPPEAYPAWLA